MDEKIKDTGDTAGAELNYSVVPAHDVVPTHCWSETSLNIFCVELSNVTVLMASTASHFLLEMAW